MQEQAEKILQNSNELKRIIRQTDLAFYDCAADAFIFPSNVEDETEIFTAIVENGQKYYPIGTFSWIWEETVCISRFLIHGGVH